MNISISNVNRIHTWYWFLGKIASIASLFYWSSIIVSRSSASLRGLIYVLNRVAFHIFKLRPTYLIDLRSFIFILFNVFLVLRRSIVKGIIGCKVYLGNLVFIGIGNILFLFIFNTFIIFLGIILLLLCAITIIIMVGYIVVSQRFFMMA